MAFNATQIGTATRETNVENKFHLRDDNDTKLCLMATSDMVGSGVSFGPCPQGFSKMREENGRRWWEGGDPMKEFKMVVGNGQRAKCPDGWQHLNNGMCKSSEKYEGPCPRLLDSNGMKENEKSQWSQRCKAPWTPFRGNKLRNVESGYCVGIDDEYKNAKLTNCSQKSSTWKSQRTSGNKVKLINPETNMCLIPKTYEATVLGNCDLSTSELTKVLTSSQIVKDTTYSDDYGDRYNFLGMNFDITNTALAGRTITQSETDKDNLVQYDTGLASRSGICSQNPSLMTRTDKEDAINFCQRFQNAQTQEERAKILQEYQITLRGEGGKDGWIPSARICNDFCYNLATYLSRTSQDPKWREEAWARPFNWTECDFDYTGGCQSFQDITEMSSNEHEFGSPAGCKADYFEKLCRSAAPPKERKGQSDTYSINNPSQNIWGVKKYHNVCVPGRRRAECQKGWYNQVQLRPFSTKCFDKDYLDEFNSWSGLSNADKECSKTYGNKWIAGVENDFNSRDFIYQGGCSGNNARASCRKLRDGETKPCVNKKVMARPIYNVWDEHTEEVANSFPGHAGDVYCQNNNTIHYPAQNLVQTAGGTYPKKGMTMGDIYGRKSYEKTNCTRDGYERMICAKGYTNGKKLTNHTTPCIKYRPYDNPAK